MTDRTYNGWTNYATWRVKLELFDDYRVFDSELCNNAYKLGQHLKDTAEVYIEDSAPEGLARDYAMAFLSNVNWYEIAEHLLEDEELSDEVAE